MRNNKEIEIEYYVPIKRWPNDYTTEEIRGDLGDFEKQYLEHCVGERISNGILGHTYQRILDWCIKEGIINKKGNAVFYQTYHNWWRHKEEGMRELWSRRDYAKRMELRDLDKVAKSFPELI